MKIYLDSANLDELRKAASWGVIDGVTTNPSLIAKEGVAIEEQIRKICDIINGDVSASVVSTGVKEMINDGRRLARIDRNIVVKLPLTSEGLTATRALAEEGIRVNVTLCFSANQAMLAAKAGAYIISPFVGRIDDLGWSGIEVVEDILKIYSNYGFKTQVLAASLRGPRAVTDVAKAGVHIATMPLRILEQLFSHPLTDKGMEQFLSDHNKVFEFAKS
jgi:transaldolase